MHKRAALAISGFFWLAACISFGPTDHLTNVVQGIPFSAKGASIGEYLPPSVKLTSLTGERAFIVLGTDTQTARNVKACEAFLQLPTKDDVTQSLGSSAPTLPTYWPARVYSGIVPRGQECDIAVGQYDWDRAALLKKVYNLPLRGGPMILAVDQSGAYFFIDLNSVSENRMLDAFRAWQGAAESGVAAGRDSDKLESHSVLPKLAKVACSQAAGSDKGALDTILKAGLSAPPWGSVAGLVIGGTAVLACPAPVTPSNSAPTKST